MLICKILFITLVWGNERKSAKILGCASYKIQSPQCILCFPLETNIFAYERGEKPICIMWNINAPTNDANFQHF